MCTACDETYKIFTIELVTKDPVNTNMELFKEIAHRLFQNKVISNININNNKVYHADNKQVFGFDVHLGNPKNPSTINLANVEKALEGLVDQFDDYSEMQIRLS